MEVILEVVIPFLMADLIDYGIDDGNMSYILKIGAVLIICAFISLLFGALAGKTAAIASAGYAKNLRQDMYYNVQNFSFANIDKFSTASIITRLTTDVSNVQNAFQMIIRLAFRSPLMLAFSLIMTITINPKLSLIFVACIPFLGIGLYIIIRHAHPIFQRVFKKYDKLNNVVQENLRGMRVVKSYVREDFEDKKFGDISEEVFIDFSKAEKLVAFNMPLMQFCMYGCMLLISWFGARLIIASGGNPQVGMSAGQLMSFIAYAMQISKLIVLFRSI
jgi:ATP-binding cassette subfamily B protein